MNGLNGNSKNKKILKRSTRRERKVKRNLWLRRVFLFLISLLFVYFAYNPIRMALAYKLAGLYQVETDVIETKMAIERGWVLREEIPLHSPSTGILTTLAPEGKRVAEGELIAKVDSLQGEVIELTAPTGGIVCYHLDGLEGVLEPKGMRNLNSIDGDLLNYQMEEISSGSQVFKGQPILKLVNNLKPVYIGFRFDIKDLEKFPSPGKPLVLRVGGEEYRTVLVELMTQGVSATAYLKVDRGEFYHAREVNFILVLKSQKGIRIPNTALVENDGQKGVYKLFATGYRFVPVNILLQNEIGSIVEGISRGDQILENPRRINF